MYTIPTPPSIVYESNLETRGKVLVIGPRSAELPTEYRRANRNGRRNNQPSVTI